MLLKFHPLNNLIAFRCFHTSAPRTKQKGIALLKLMRKKQRPFNRVRYYDEVDRSGEKAVYPEIRGDYPVGGWGNMDKELAWKWHRISQKLLTFPDLFDRLNEMYQIEKNMWYHSLECPLNYPQTLDFYKFITRSVMVPTEPQLSIDDDLSEGDFGQLSNQCKELLTVHSKNGTVRTAFVTDLLDCAHQWLSPRFDHVRDVQIDEGGNLETFIKRSGYDGLKMVKDIDPTVLDEEGCVKYRIRSRTSWQMRSRNPLPPFFPRDAIPTSDDAVPQYNYHPAMFGLSPVDCYGISVHPATRTFQSNEFLVNKAGYWTKTIFFQGDPCEFGTFGVVERREPKFMDDLRNCEPEVAKRILADHYIGEGMMAAFAWTSAQAWNQGFNFYNDITYPFSTQLVLTDGREFRFLLYQLNSLSALSRGRESGLPVNIGWVSEPLALYEAVTDGGEVLGWNEEVVRKLVRHLVLKSNAIGDSSALRPNLQCKAPRDEAKFINLAGEADWKRPPARRVYTQGLPHPNEIFFLKTVTREEMVEEIQKTNPDFAKLPEKYEAIADEYRRQQRFIKKKRQKTEKGPEKWR